MLEKAAEIVKVRRIRILTGKRDQPGFQQDGRRRGC